MTGESRRRQRGEEREKQKRRQSNFLENLFIIILAFYPLRHITWGLDLWDTGYHYANFQYMGTQHMDPMWLFSTYLANAAGHFLTDLPSGDTMMGMNLYTGLFASALALTGYFFCTRKLGMPRWIVFLGEMAAESMCWCPTAALYNYMTYLFFLAGTILLYLGLTREKRYCLLGAGGLLGANVLVRFPNLAEAAMILAVWGYDFIIWLEDKGRPSEAPGEAAAYKEGFWRRTLGHTGWCLLGYVAALVVLLNYIHICYGIDQYTEGIGRLFSMTDNALDYKPSAMVMGIIGRYVECMYWVLRIGVILAGGLVLFAAADRLQAALGKKLLQLLRILWVAVCGAMVVWLYQREFFSFVYYSYDSIWYPGPIFLMLAMLIALIRIFSRNCPREEKLLGGMLILTIFLTSIGGNNGVFPSLNNLFLAAPYTLWEIWRFMRTPGRNLLFPVKAVLITLTGLCLFQFAGFGWNFVFAESTGIQNPDTYVYNNQVLKNIRMDARKSQWIMELSEYVNENALAGKESILYGKIPAISYYMQMPAAFNPWIDLDSYSLEALAADLARQEGYILEKGAEKPVVILEDSYARYLEEEKGEDSLFPLTEEERESIGADPKWQMLMAFMERQGYEKNYRNSKFALYR